MKRKIIQICSVVRNLDDSIRQYKASLGFGPWNVYTFNQKTVRDFTYHGRRVKEPFEFKIAVTMVGDTQFELVQPIMGSTIYKDFLMKKGEGYHHIKEKIEDNRIDNMLKSYKKKGIDVIQSGRFDDDVFYYLDTEHLIGIVFELGNCGKVRKPERRIF